jgi:hypothetical protein
MRLTALTTVVGLFLGACGDDPATRDAGSDGGIVVSRPPDGGPPSLDAGSDAGVDSGSDAGAVPSGVGQPCASDADCTGAAPTCLTESEAGLPGGYCSLDCLDDFECPHDSDCVPIGTGPGWCFARCDRESKDACRTGYGCGPGDEEVSEGLCYPGCEADADCAAGQRCEREGGFTGSGACYTVDAALGDPCALDSDCGMSQFCYVAWPGGACVLPGCDLATNDCPGDAVCIMPSRFSFCVDGCTADGDCRPDYRCLAPPETPERTHCAPPP